MKDRRVVTKRSGTRIARPIGPRTIPLRSWVACVCGLERRQCLLRLPPHCNQSSGMDRHGTCDKMQTLLQFDLGRGDTWRALQRWTGVAVTRCDAPELPRNIRYCRGDPEKGAQIARDVASMPRRPPPRPGQLPTKHGMQSRFAIRNTRLLKGGSLSHG